MPFVGSTDINSVLLVEDSQFAATDRALVLSAVDPALPLAIARKSAAVDVYDESFSALQRLRQQMAARHAGSHLTVCEDVFPPSDSSFDVALMVVPKGRDFARAQLWSALKALRPGGKLYIAGPSDGGAKTVLTDAAVLFGSSTTVNYKRRHRIGVAIRPEVIPDYPWGHDPMLMQQQTINAPGGAVEITTMPGVFSWQHLDDGTALLLEELNVQADQDVLDVGCGNGIIGVVAAKQAKSVMMIDDNLLAIRCARSSIAANQLGNADVLASDVYNEVVGQQYDLIVSNPPFHKKFDVNTNVAYRMIRGAKAMLRGGGRLVIVANAFLNYEQVMSENFAKTRVITRNNRFIVIEGRK
jgi:16S rRNA (guanine1207-N2)-methyltransferase